jgi:hypothetical protein
MITRTAIFANFDNGRTEMNQNTRQMKSAQFTDLAKEKRTSLPAEFWFFLKHNKKWWLLPIIIILLLLGLLLMLGGTAIAPFIYPLF